MAGLLATLGGNPFNTPVGQKIEQATDASLQVENWALNMEICDIINETDEGPKDSVRAIRKRLQQNMGKNYTVVLYTLTVLETCVKNCGRRFHLLICQKDFVLDLVKLIGPKNDPPLAIQDRVLSLIQSWADAFLGNPEMQGVVHVYQELKEKGIEFPMTDLDTLAPIITPQRTSVPVAAASDRQPVSVSASTPVSTSPPTRDDTSSSSNISTNSGLKVEQVAKLKSELGIVQGNMKVFNEMLTEMSPGNEHPEDLQLLNELHKTLFAMQNRIVELIDRIGVEEITNELLRLNDDLNNLFLRYKRYIMFQQRALQQQQQQQQSTTVKSSEVPVVEAVSDKPLIDFEDSGEVVEAIAQLDLASGGGDQIPKVQPATVVSASDIADEFDMFAQSRNVSYEASKNTGSSYADNMNLDHLSEGLGYYAQNKGQPQLRDDDIKDVAHWLSDKPATKTSSGSTVPNSDFEKFLAERASAADHLPDITTSNNRPAASSRRQLEKEDPESALFTL